MVEMLASVRKENNLMPTSSKTLKTMCIGNQKETVKRMGTTSMENVRL